MDWQGALRARLINAVPVTSLVGQRVYWVDRPQNTDLPAITMQLVVEERPQTMSGFDGYNRSVVQVDFWGNSYGEVQAVKEAAIAAVIGENISNGISFARAFIDSIRDLGERTETKFIHRTSADLIIHHSVA